MFVQPQDVIDPTFVEVSHLHRNLTTDGAAGYAVHLKQCLDWVSANPSWRLSLQTHKLLGVR